MADDIQYQIRCSLKDPTHCVHPGELKKLLVDELAVDFAKNGANILDYALPSKTACDGAPHMGSMLADELPEDSGWLLKLAGEMLLKLNKDQRKALFLSQIG